MLAVHVSAIVPAVLALSRSAVFPAVPAVDASAIVATMLARLFGVVAIRLVRVMRVGPR
jgi:hypothetical protein